jgi:hypothetical protein
MVGFSPGFYRCRFRRAKQRHASYVVPAGWRPASHWVLLEPGRGIAWSLAARGDAGHRPRHWVDYGSCGSLLQRRSRLLRCGTMLEERLSWEPGLAYLRGDGRHGHGHGPVGTVDPAVRTENRRCSMSDLEPVSAVVIAAAVLGEACVQSKQWGPLLTFVGIALASSH